MVYIKPTKGLNFRREHYAPHPFMFIPAPMGNLSFGQMPKIIYRRTGEVIEAGEIRLRFGEHWGPNHGYGIHHILQEHRQLFQASPNVIADVVEFIASIVQPRAEIYCEFASIRGKHRPIVVCRPHGQVVLEPKWACGVGDFYSVVTAIPTTQTKGPRIGAL